jgi:sulfotransferase
MVQDGNGTKPIKNGFRLIFLSGLPRTGSTLLTSILSQNPKIHAEGNSALCQLMWDLQISCEINAKEQLESNNRINTKNTIMSSLPKIYYKNAKNKIIIDKCRTWTLPANLKIIENYILSDFKMIVMVRPMIEIVKSFVFIRQLNNWENPEFGLLDENSDPIMRSFNGLINVKNKNSNNFIFVEYDDLINEPQKTIKKIYKFLNLHKFNHNFDHIINTNLENDQILGLKGLHDIRPNISKRNIEVKISKKLEEKANFLTSQYE